jgi:hypothetical protein
MQKFFDRLGYRFRDVRVLTTALTHPSYGSDHHTEHYQRLEFLGDAVLELAISRRLYEKLPQGSKTGIQLFLAIALSFVQILTASAAEAFAIFTAQKLHIHIQHKYCTDDLFQVGAITCQGEYPFVFVSFIGKLRNQNHI